MPDSPVARASHRLLRMSGRDPDESHRVATPLELLFDLVFVVAFGAAGNELAHALAEDHIRAGIVAFCFAVFAICWAWINYSWFASAYDVDDWAYRLLTMVQMVGVIVMALGMPELFDSVYVGKDLDNGVIVVGYVIMRISMVGFWLRVAIQDPGRRACARVYIITITLSQIGWCVLLFTETNVNETFALATVPLAIELSGPVIAERKYGGTPWHAHHIAERYGLLTIITLGEGVLGTVAAMSAVVHAPDLGWTTDAVIVLAAGIGLTFGMWWTYFAIPWAEVLEHHRERSFIWGYGHIFIFGSIAATGAGLHVAAYYLEHHTELSSLGTVAAVAVPVAVYILVLYGMYSLVMHAADPFHLSLLAGTAAVLALAGVLAANGTSMAWCLVVVALSPVVTIVGYEALGHRHMQDHLERLRA
jgi:low temperature requirement protein LtrA